MISGIVTPAREAVIALTVRGPAGAEEEIAAIIDTGFDGSLTLPADIIARLGLAWRRRGRALLADGRESLFEIYESVVIWDGNPVRVAVDAAEMFPLVGMSLLDGHELTIQVRPEGVVKIERLA